MKYLTYLFLAITIFACNIEDEITLPLEYPKELSIEQVLYGEELKAQTSVDVTQVVATTGKLLSVYRAEGMASVELFNKESNSFEYPVNNQQKKYLKKVAGNHLLHDLGLMMPELEVAFPNPTSSKSDEVVSMSELRKEIAKFAEKEEGKYYETLLLTIDNAVAMEELMLEQLNRISTSKTELSQDAIDRVVGISAVVFQTLSAEKASCGRRAVKAAAAGALIGGIRGAVAGCTAGLAAAGVGCGPGALAGGLSGAATGAAWGLVSGLVACIIFD